MGVRRRHIDISTALPIDNNSYISVILRCFGVLLLTFHRYISICRHQTKIEKFMNVSHRWTLPIIQWTVPLLYSIPLFGMNGVVFESDESLELIAKPHQTALATIMTASWVYITFVLCSFCYGALLRFFFKNRYNKNDAIKRELRLYVQMLGLLIAFVLLFFYYITRIIISFNGNEGPVLELRVMFPLVSAFMSYINVWLMFILNSDIRKKIINLVLFHNKQRAVTKTVAIKSTQSTIDLRKI
ncbi:hypothetical protein DICVIV_06691 [Dictyocaulus viviparus]|uniref:G-protein coupled receptors family 1 profile domain-containing protein n=1 Tax=Dictyocaulus viviparus TaxID=29172 RepID=A0A0D8XTV1_DICVI|nr:hypothetical protein DICVIV_06691 [Dictyocaulus viviparus]